MVKTLPRTISALVAVLTLVVSAPPEGAFVTGVARGSDGLDGRRIEAFRPWRDD